MGRCICETLLLGEAKFETVAKAKASLARERPNDGVRAGAYEATLRRRLGLRPKSAVSGLKTSRGSTPTASATAYMHFCGRACGSTLSFLLPPALNSLARLLNPGRPTTSERASAGYVGFVIVMPIVSAVSATAAAIQLCLVTDRSSLT